jgi:UDP-GlcNAc:undecaprenyl-phosphate GlcNAc-1-phosphate transferase
LSNIYEYIITFALAFIIAFSATPIARKIAFRFGVIDVPKDDRRMHSKPIALMGGLAIVTGFVFSLVFDLVTVSNIITTFKEFTGLIAGIAVIVFMGILDDKKKLRPRIKLAFQLAAAIVVVMISDTKISRLTNPFGNPAYLEFSPIISYPLTILWIVGITNAINLIDGLDGLAAGVSSISSLSLFFISMLRQDLVSPQIAAYTALITAALSGSTLGFLPFNFNPAKIFMGETGAAFLGFTLGVISIQGVMKSYAAISIAIPLLVLGLPLIDTLFAIVRRIVTRKSVAQADRRHFHHRLMDMGLSQRQSVLIMYTVSGTLGLCAIVLADRGTLSAVILLVAASIFIAGGTKYMNSHDSISDEYVKDQEKPRETILPDKNINKPSDGVTK